MEKRNRQSLIAASRKCTKQLFNRNLSSLPRMWIRCISKLNTLPRKQLRNMTLLICELSLPSPTYLFTQQPSRSILKRGVVYEKSDNFIRYSARGSGNNYLSEMLSRCVPGSPWKSRRQKKEKRVSRTFTSRFNI